jgi:peptidoglycan/xylan/chitin deacetylase (PgdA/CDA1 family)
MNGSLLKHLALRTLNSICRPWFTRVRSDNFPGFVLVYHRVTPDQDESHPPLPPEHFYSHCEELKRNFTVLPLEEMVQRRNAGRSVRGCCSITFDDGQLDCLEHAAPILRSFGFTATNFLVADCVVTGRPVWTLRLNRLAWRTRKNPSVALPANAKETLGAMSSDDRELQLQSWEAPISGRAPEPSMITASHLKQWEGTIAYQSHTKTHSMLALCSESAIRAEMEQSRSLLGGLLGTPPIYLSYPNNSYDSRVVRLAQEAGFEAAFTVDQRPIRDQDSAYALPRFDVATLWGPYLRLELYGVLPRLRTLRGRLFP